MDAARESGLFFVWGIGGFIAIRWGWGGWIDWGDRSFCSWSGTAGDA